MGEGWGKGGEMGGVRWIHSSPTLVMWYLVSAGMFGQNVIEMFRSFLVNFEFLFCNISMMCQKPLL